MSHRPMLNKEPMINEIYSSASLAADRMLGTGFRRPAFVGFIYT